MHRLLTATIAALFALLLSAPALGQDGEAANRVEKLSAWPQLKKADRDRARAAIKQLRKEKPELRDAAAAKLIKMGAGVAPLLIAQVSDKAQNINLQLFAVLDEVVDKLHLSLLARELKRKSVACRRYLMRRIALGRDPDMAPVLKARLQDKDEDIAFYAALGALALGDGAGLETMLAAARQRWTEHQALIASTLTPVRSREVSRLVWEHIGQARATDKMAGLRLLRHLATKDEKVLLRAYLESADFAVKREAINTARVLHGEKPLEKLSSFQAINLAKQWLQKL